MSPVPPRARSVLVIAVALAALHLALGSTLSPEEQRLVAIYGRNYGEAGAIDWFGPALGLPHAVSGHNSYFLWGPPADGRGAILIAVGDRLDLERMYSDVQKIDETDLSYAMPSEIHRAIYLCRGLRGPLRDASPSLKIYV